LQLNAPQEAAREFRYAATMDPSQADAIRGLAVALIEAGRLAEAERVLRRSIPSVGEAVRWQLHLILSQLLIQVGDELGDRRFYDEALKEVNQALYLQPGQADLYFHRGIIQSKLDDFVGALRNFRSSLSADAQQFMAERYAKWVEARLRSEQASLRFGRAGSLLLGVLSMLVLIVLLVLYVSTDKVTDAVLLALIPILLGFLVVAAVLPALIRLKLPGLEAELTPLQPQKPLEAIPLGPKGELRVGSSLPAGRAELRFW
jgi:tetratricopeptide (TPR) repeat protein